ncbi:hypothetical protein WUBG_09226, partial [Wuchereria bancrofti]
MSSTQKTGNAEQGDIAEDIGMPDGTLPRIKANRCARGVVTSSAGKTSRGDALVQTHTHIRAHAHTCGMSRWERGRRKVG